MINILFYSLNDLIFLPFYIINFDWCICVLVAKAKKTYLCVCDMYIIGYMLTNGYELLYDCVKDYDILQFIKKYHIRIVIILLHYG